MANPQPDHVPPEVAGFEAAVSHAVRRWAGPMRGILAAVSGGPDSLALLISLARIAPALGLKLEVATLDHGLREEGPAEAEQVLAVARGLGLRAHRRSLQLAGGAGIEARAREARYQALEELRLDRGLALIATGHTGSDQAETVLMRLARGSALAGAAGIQPRSPTLIRPLLAVTRAEVITYLSALGQGWAEDPMNSDPGFLRVRVRLQLLPLYEVVAGPKVSEHLARFAEYAGEDEALLDRQAQAALARISQGLKLDAVGLEALERPIRRRVIARWLSGNQLEVDAALLEDVLDAVAEGRTATLPKDQVMVMVDGWVGLEAAPARRPSRNFTVGAGTGNNDRL